MKKMRANAAGIDIGAKHIFVSLENKDVRVFETFTESFREASSYLLSEGIETVAMEATGVYWIILYEILESAGLDVWLVDGRQTRQVPGRKTDVKDCQWIQQLHSHGLLNRCFVPDAQVKEVRAYQRLREDHLRTASMHVNHMQKSLIEMNIRLKEVLSQVHGASGLAIIEAILSGERDAQKLLSLCHSSIREKKASQVLKALSGYYTEAGLFALEQAFSGYKFYKQQIQACDHKLEEVMKRVNNYDSDMQSKNEIESVKDRKPVRHNKPDIDHLGGHLLKIFSGKDATCLPGITDYTWLQLYSEIGLELYNWPSEKHFTSWLGLSPGQHQSGKKNKTRNRKYRPKAGQIFRQLAQSLIESKKIALGAFGRRLKSKRGPGIATKATARKLAVLYWRLMVKGLDYTEKGIKAYEEKMQLHREKWLIKTAKELGYELEQIPI
ncbi:IS110 family transposase [Fulvivirga ligni]|uniref:IS110 family transposase n=1 Tax=Fulvivirga ligni TaxID=2904246 RepID=UPI001F39401C|nr:IS110 family transposase [Fulvivirga ligni]UII20703.1 IS110 family transposase [Fulvivirga ligni]UII21560.1 IS110 family transposase [Fulvivirga ligni]UII21692.1 IS110 family transposase [Fulvivirga ligni]